MQGGAMKPKLLDLFCCAGGSATGYHRAGFEVVGVDIAPQPHFPFEFHKADALEYLAEHGHEFDAIHASLPCQAYSVTYSMPNVGAYPELIVPVRNLLISTGKPYVIENVPGAPLVNPLELCGSMFGLQLIRHRWFEIGPPVWFPPAPHRCKDLYTASSRTCSTFANGATAITVAGHNYILEEGKRAMGIDWMTSRDELSEAIPPAYTEFIGSQLIKVLEGER
jgi:DNA (cytosine-5)-methyltransferase 1